MVRGIYVAAIATVMTLALTGVLPVQLSPSTAATVAPGWHATASYRPRGQRPRRVVCPERITRLGHLRRRGGRRRPCRLHHRDRQRWLHLVRCNTTHGRHEPFGRVVSLRHRVLRGRRFRDHEVDQRWVDVDGPGRHIPGSVSLLLHDHRVHCGRWCPNRTNNGRQLVEPTDSSAGTDELTKRLLSKCDYLRGRRRLSTPTLRSSETQDGSTWIDLGSTICESLVSRLVWWIHHCVPWALLGWRRHVSSTTDFTSWTKTSSTSIRLSIDAQSRVSNVDHLHRRRHQSQRQPVRNRDFEQRRHLVGSKSARRTQSM